MLIAAVGPLQLRLAQTTGNRTVRSNADAE